MNELSQSRLASSLTALVGIWVAISPIWITMTHGAMVSAIITGIVIVLAGLVQLFVRNTVPSWISGIAAVWLVISVFAFGSFALSVWNQIISAIVVFIFANWDGVELSNFNSHHAHTV